MLAKIVLALATLLAPADDAPAGAALSLDRITSFSNVVVNHVNASIGTESLPQGSGLAVEPGVFVTIGTNKLQVFDRDAATLQRGLVTDGATAQECKSGCPAVLFDAFQYEWLKMAVESSYLEIDIATRVLFAASADVPAQTLLMSAYAAAETRPGAVPTISILVNMAGRGLRAQPVFLLPPEGLTLQQGSAALGLTIEFDAETFVVSGADATLGRGKRGKSLTDVRRILATVKKRYPGKDSIILVPRAGVTVGQLMTLVQVIRTSYPRIVLSLGQDVVI
ncbi:MAG: hypothetical protein KUG77_22310 [Nannocystaceae bacterium]|nr:hypothetical protein [Nannocystaceae bacterium]